MRRFVWILLLCSATIVHGQLRFNTVIQKEPVTKGDAFRVQYVAEGFSGPVNIKNPVFPGFRLISGPDKYSGSVSGRSVQNFVYTIEAIRSGRHVIPGATLISEGTSMKSQDVIIDIVEAGKLKPEDENSVYLLKPGEDPLVKTRENLFIRVDVDRQSCFVGEPIVATFKLFSRLQSRSDIVKNPGFYGFAVYDMIGLADKIINTEVWKGKSFDVHTIRKVQLYPLQAGIYYIDPMEVRNKVEFSRTAVNKKTEQQIFEGSHDDNLTVGNNAEIFENEISTEPIKITVSPLSEKNKPPDFETAVGDFSMQVNLDKTALTENEKAELEIVLKGRGNFIQVTAPQVQWPRGIESFEPIVVDSFDKTKSPITGSRKFRYAFIAKQGRFVIPPIKFSFFNPDSGRYKTIFTKEQSLVVNPPVTRPALPAPVQKKKRNPALIWILAAASIIFISSLVFILRQRKTRKENPELTEKALTPPSINELLQNVTMGEEKKFYWLLQNAIWTFFDRYFILTGSDRTRENLLYAMRQKNMDEALILTAEILLAECELTIFTGAPPKITKEELLAETRSLMEQTEKQLLL